MSAAIFYIMGVHSAYRYGPKSAAWIGVGVFIAALLDRYFGPEVGYALGAATRSLWLHITGAA